MNDAMKQNIRGKVNSYLKRAEEIKKIPNGSGKKKAVADGASSKDNKDDDDSSDPDRKRMMQKFEGTDCDNLFLTLHCITGAIVADPNVSFADVIGLDQAKEALKEAVILPVKFPQLFQGTPLFPSHIPHDSLALSRRQTKTMGWHPALRGMSISAHHIIRTHALSLSRRLVAASWYGQVLSGEGHRHRVQEHVHRGELVGSAVEVAGREREGRQVPV